MHLPASASRPPTIAFTTSVTESIAQDGEGMLKVGSAKLNHPTLSVAYCMVVDI